MSDRYTVLCPGCGGDWELERSALPAMVECECGVTLEVTAGGAVTQYAQGAQRAGTGAEDLARLRPVRELVREILESHACKTSPT